MTKRVISSVSVLIVVIACLAGSLAPSHADPGSRQPGPHSGGRRNTPPGLADARFERHAAPVEPVSVVLTLDLRDHAGVDALLAAQQEPTSPLYHQWISPEEFQARFGPLPSDLQATKDFLRDAGFTNISQPTSTMIAAQGNVAIAERVFQVAINRYTYHGRRVFSNDRDPVLPAHLSSKILHVGGLENLTIMFPHITRATSVDPNYVLSGTNYMLARDNQVAYGQKAAYFDAGMRGIPGAELAVASSFGADVTALNNILTREGGAAAGYNLFTAATSGARTLSNTCVPGSGSAVNAQGCLYDQSGPASIETMLDTSLAASVANDNHVGVYLAQDQLTTSFSVVYQYLADRASTIKVVTHSWGLCLSLMSPSVVTADDNALAQAAAGGQAWFTSSGDGGSNDCPAGSGGANPDVNYPSASPYVTSAGGTSQDPTGAFGGDGWMAGYPPNGEVACSDAGGGQATAGVTEPRPSWQTGTGVPAGSNRLIPDISMHYGTCVTPSTGKSYLTVAGNFLWLISGTSADAPQLAGYWAVANQVVGANLGQAGPLLFRILRNEAGTSYANSFHDITSGDNGAYTATPGFDQATGIGTPKFNNLYIDLAKLLAPGTLQGTVTAGGPPAVGATVTATGVPGTYTTTTNGSGFYQFAANIPAGTYSVTAAAGGYVSGTAAGVVVNSASTTIQNFTLNTLAATSGCLTDTTQFDFQAGAASTNLDLTTSPGDAKLKIASGGTVADQNTLDDIGGFAFSNTNWAAQTFTPAVSGQLSRVDLYLFCSGCSGANPNITVSIRNVASNLPTGADLATATITGFNDAGAGTWVSASFGVPASVTAGTLYAVVWRLNAARTGSQAYVSSGTTAGGGDGDVYSGGRGCTSANSGSTWTCSAVATAARDNDFVSYVTNTIVYNASADLTSSVKDGNPLPAATPHISSLTWTAATPANTAVKFQLATSGSSTGPFSFIGPDGTSGTFFTTSGQAVPGNLFMGRYFKYKAFLSTTATAATPTLSAVTVCYDNTCTGLNAGTSCGDPTSNACTAADTCDGAGACQTNNSNNGSNCGDTGTDCTNQDTCLAGVCQDNGFKSSSTGCTTDNNVCTDDHCDGAGACVHPANTASCDDGLFCNGADTCSSGVCGHVGNPCTGGAECNNGCSEADDTCFNSSTTGCTNDANLCTDDHCDGAGACVHTNNTAACDDGVFCNGTDTCAGGSCGHAGDPCAGGAECNSVCNESSGNCFNPATTGCTDDGNVCSDDHCDGAGVCAHPANTASCNDGNACTVGDTCSGGVCSGTGITAPPETQNVTVASDKATYSWSAAPLATRYDVVRGSLAALPVGPGGLGSPDETCFDDLGSTTLVDGDDPGSGNGFWYLSRGENACGNGTYGTQSNGSPRLTTTCP